MRTFTKIFGIGQNKTGTSSLHAAFELLGLASMHHAPAYDDLSAHLRDARVVVKTIEAAKRAGTPLLAAYDQYDAFSDVGPVIRYYATVDEQYPGAKFIYTHRSVDLWIESRVKHVERNRAAKRDGSWESPFLRIEPEKWRRNWFRHQEAVFDHFSGRPDDLLVMDVTDGDGFDQLCPFLGIDEPTEPFPWRNKAVDSGTV